MGGIRAVVNLPWVGDLGMKAKMMLRVYLMMFMAGVLVLTERRSPAFGATETLVPLTDISLPNHPLWAANLQEGIEGQVEIKPVRPHVTFGEVNTKPYQTKIEVLDTQGRLVTSSETDPNGKFQIVLSPGKYIVRSPSTGLYPRSSEQRVLVTPGHFTHMHITFDSGIR
jgi:hypothetical protein